MKLAIELAPWAILAAFGAFVILVGRLWAPRRDPEKALWGWPPGDAGEPQGPVGNPNARGAAP